MVGVICDRLAAGAGWTRVWRFYYGLELRVGWREGMAAPQEAGGCRSLGVLS